jgi:hypothetical protein
MTIVSAFGTAIGGGTGDGLEKLSNYTWCPATAGASAYVLSQTFQLDETIDSFDSTKQAARS